MFKSMITYLGLLNDKWICECLAIILMERVVVSLCCNNAIAQANHLVQPKLNERYSLELL